MEYQEAFDRTAKAIRSILGPNISLAPETKAIQVEHWDSLAHTSILLAIETEFGKQLDIEKGMGVENLDELVRLVLES